MNNPGEQKYSKLSGTLAAAADTSLRSQPLYRPKQPTDINTYKNLNTKNYEAPNNYAPSQSGLGSITTQYGGSTNYEKFHPAVDIANKMGTPIPAFKGGTVVEVSTGKKQGDKGYGNYVIIKDGEGNKWRYSHLKDEYVKMGQVIPQGSVLGTMGNTGSTYSNSGGDGTHLDLRVMNAYNKYINPTPYITSALKKQ